MDQFNPPTKEEAMEWLKVFMQKVNTQDNRATASPFFYTIKFKYDDGDTERTRNMFLTADAAEKYLEENKHNLPNSYVYLDHAYRNEELRSLLLSLGTILDMPYNWR